MCVSTGVWHLDTRQRKGSIEGESGAVLASSNTVLNFELHKIEIYLFSFSELSSFLLGNTVIFNSLNPLTGFNLSYIKNQST